MQNHPDSNHPHNQAHQRQHALRRRDLLEQARREREIALELERSALNQMEDDVWGDDTAFFDRLSHFTFSHGSIPIDDDDDDGSDTEDDDDANNSNDDDDDDDQ